MIAFSLLKETATTETAREHSPGVISAKQDPPK